jgi:agmatinase
MTIDERIAIFDPNGLAEDNGHLYGLPFTVEEAAFVIIPVPWEVTVSYANGTAGGPEAILAASKQVDLYDPYIKDAWKLGLAMEEIDAEVRIKSDFLRLKTEEYLSLYEQGELPENNKQMMTFQEEINAGSKWLNEWVRSRVILYFNSGKKVAILGGDHSTPLGMIQALSTVHSSFGILQIDAHADLRDAYEGLTFSHASIMFNALQIEEVTHLTQVGIRDYCDAEKTIIEQNPKIKTFFDHDIKNRQLGGESWDSICEDIVASIPDLVYLSFDIDGLDPKLCPNTGTPVPGGFEFEQVVYLIRKVISAGKKIIAFDINEVAPGDDEWDANVGARLLYRISNLFMSQNV